MSLDVATILTILLGAVALIGAIAVVITSDVM